MNQTRSYTSAAGLRRRRHLYYEPVPEAEAETAPVTIQAAHEAPAPIDNPPNAIAN